VSNVSVGNAIVSVPCSSRSSISYNRSLLTYLYLFLYKFLFFLCKL